MMDEIKAVIMNQGELSEAQILEAFHELGNQGNLVLFKNDALREKAKMTVVITSFSNAFDSIRFDGETLSGTLSRALQKYFELLAKGEGGGINV